MTEQPRRSAKSVCGASGAGLLPWADLARQPQPAIM